MRGMTLDDLSIQIGYTSSYISYIEKGNNTPSVFVVKKISDALNIPIEKLFNDTKKRRY
jgi:transcriptional regulator with XRE-family HTH domain